MEIKKVAGFIGSRWRILVLSLIAQLVLSFLLHLNVAAPKFLNFLSFQQITQDSSLVNLQPQGVAIFNQVRLKLEQKINNFHLKKTSGLASIAFASAPFDQSASYLAMSYEDGQVLAEKQASQQLPVASLTKIMTAVVALDLASPDEVFIVSQRAQVTEPTKIGVVAGQKMTLEELLNAALLTSANDAVQVIKEGVDNKYGRPIFVQAMNTKAEFLGLKNTHFDNPQGFDGPNNYSSAEDLGLLSRYALENYPLIAQITKKDYQFLPADNNHKQFDLYNWNGLLGVYPGVLGLKIGNTDSAGYTTIVVSERSGQKVLAVLLGAPGALERDLWTSQLLDLGFSKLGIASANITQWELKQKYQSWKYWN